MAMLCIVFFHACGFVNSTVHFPLGTEVNNNSLYWKFLCIGTKFSLEIFTVIAGFLFALLFNRGKYNNPLSFLKKKIMRLLVPYFVFIHLMIFTTGDSYILATVFSGSYMHLWYLPTLFWCFICGYMMIKCIKKRSVWIIVWLILAFLPRSGISLPEFMGLQNLLTYLSWFVLGIIIFATDYSSMIRYKWVPPLLLAPYFLFVCMGTLEDNNSWYTNILQAMVILGVWGMAFFYSKYVEKYVRPLLAMSGLFFSIYLLHYWIGTYLISRTAKSILPLEHWAAHHGVLFSFGLGLVMLLLSWGAAWIIHKTKIGRMLLS